MADLALLYRVFGALVLVFIVQRLAGAILSPLRSVPGPFLARWTDLWYLWHVSGKRWEKRNLELHRRYGPVVRYGPNRYSISDPAALATIYGHGTRFVKSSWYNAWAAPGRSNIFSDRSIPRHAEARRQLQSTYSMTSLVSYEPFVDRCTELFARRLEEMSSGDAVDMGHWFQCYAFDVIGEITYGKRIGFLDAGDDIQGIMSAIVDQLGFSTLLGIYVRFHRLAFILVNYIAGEKGAGREYLINLTRGRISEEQVKRKEAVAKIQDGEVEEDEEEEERGDGIAGAATPEPFVSKFLAKHEQDSNKFPMDLVLGGCVTNIAAGSDTTSISLSAILYYLIKNPECMRKLRREVADFQAQGLLSSSSSSSFVFKETQQMPYLQAVIKETLRVHPATGLPLEREVPEGGATISGRFFPAGTIVGINSWVAHGDRDVFGADADEFNPERWLTSDTEKLAAMNRLWIPFGVGSRTCLGRHISTLEISKLIPRIARDFDFEMVGKSWTTHNYWFVKPRGFKVKVARRVPEAILGER